MVALGQHVVAVSEAPEGEAVSQVDRRAGWKVDPVDADVTRQAHPRLQIERLVDEGHMVPLQELELEAGAEEEEEHVLAALLAVVEASPVVALMRSGSSIQSE